MPGILAQFPDLTGLLNSRGLLAAGLRSVTDPLPLDPTTLTKNLAAGLDALDGSVPADPRAFIAPLQAALTSLGGVIPKDLPAFRELRDGISRALPIIEPAREILVSGNGLRDLREIVFEKAGNPDVFINGLLAELPKFIPADAIEVLKTFIATIREFEANIPSDPNNIAQFLAQSFLGMPLSLLAEPVGVVSGFHARIDALVDSSGLESLGVNIQKTAGQLVSVQTLIKNLNLADAASYQAVTNALKGVQTEMASIQNRLGGLASGFQSGMAALDVNGFTNSLQSKLRDFPEIRVAQVDDFLNLVREPLRQLNRKLDQVTPDQLAQAFAGGREIFAAAIGEQGFAEIRETMLKPFRDVGAAIASLSLDRVRAAITAALTQIRDAINQVATTIETFKDEVKKVLDKIGEVLGTVNLAGNEVESAVHALVTQVESALNSLSLADFGNQVEGVIAQLDALLTNFMTTIGPAVEALNAFRDQLEKINLRQEAEPAFEAIETVTAILEKLDLSLVAGDQAAELRAKLDRLTEIDLGPVRQKLMSAYDEAIPRGAFHDLAEKYQALTVKMSEYDPGTLLDPLLPAFEQLKNALHQFDPAALLQPVIPRLEVAKVTLDHVSPTQLIGPLAQSFGELTSAMDALRPSRLLQPVIEVFQNLMTLFEKLDINPLLDDLEKLFVEWLEKGLSGLQQAGGGFGGAGDLKSYLDGLDGAPGTTDFGYMASDLLRPVEDLFNKIMSLLDRVPENTLLAAFGSLQSQFVTGLQTIEPSGLAGNLNSRLRERVSKFDFLNNSDVLGGLFTPYSNIVLEFDTIDPIQVPAALRANYSELAALITAVDPLRVSSSLRSQFRGLNGSILSFTRAFSSAGLSPVFGPIKEKLDKLIPTFLHGELKLNEIKAQLQQLNPGRLADELNQEFEAFLVRITKFGDTLVEELPKLAETTKAGTAAFLPELIKEAFNAVYGPLRTQLEALNPASIVADLENNIFNPVKTALEGLNPANIVNELGLDTRFNEFTATLDSLINNLKSIQTTTSRFWSELLITLDEFDPTSLKEQAQKAFVPAQQFIMNLDLARTLEAFDQAVTRIGNDLDRILQDAEAALEDMNHAIPS